MTVSSGPSSSLVVREQSAFLCHAMYMAGCLSFSFPFWAADRNDHGAAV